MEMNGHIHAPAALSPRREPGHALDGPQNRSGGEEKKNPLSALAGSQTPVVQPVLRFLAKGLISAVQGMEPDHPSRHQSLC